MAWFGDTFGDGLSSLKGQITKITKDVLSEDPLAVTSYEGRIKELEGEIQSLKIKNNVENGVSQEENMKDLLEENQNLKKMLEELDTEHEAAMQIIIDEREHLRSMLREATKQAENKVNCLKVTEETEIPELSEGEALTISLRAQLTKKENEITASLQENARLQRELSATNEELASNKEILNDFNDRLETSEDEAKKLYEQLQAREEDVRVLTAKLEQHQKEFNETENQLEQAECLIHGLMDEAEKSTEIQTTYEVLTYENNELKCRLAKLETKSDQDDLSKDRQIALEQSWQAKEESLSSQITEYKIQLDNKLQKEQVLESEVRESKDKLIANDKKNEKLFEELELLKASAEKNKKRINDLEIEIANRQENILDLERSLNDKGTALKTALSEIEALKSKEEASRLSLEIVPSVGVTIEATSQTENEVQEFAEPENLPVEVDDAVTREEFNKLEDELEAKIVEIQTINRELDEAKKKNYDLIQSSESVKIKYDVIKQRFITTEEQNNHLLQQLGLLNTQNEAKEIAMSREKSELQRRLEESRVAIDSMIRENKEVREKLDKVGFGVLAGDFDAQFRKLQHLASRMDSSLPRMSGSGEAAGYDGDLSQQQCQTDDVKRLQQDLSNITTYIGLIENGVSSLESNVNQWAAAVQTRDQLIQNQQSHILEVEETKKALEANVETLTEQAAEWQRRQRELQVLYESDVGRLEALCQQRENYDVTEVTQSSGVDTASIQDQVTRLLSENADLKQLVQQLRNNMLEINSRSTVQSSSSPTSPNPTSGIPEAQFYELKEKEASLSKEVERLRAHLEEVEEHYTTEAVSNHAEMNELRQKLTAAEEQLNSSTTVYKSANVRATQHVDALNTQLQLITVQRNDLQVKLSEAEDQAQKQAAALTSLQVVLEQFQLDKQRELQATEERYKYMNTLEKRRVSEVEQEVVNLKRQLAEANNGLKAALRLGQQLESKSHQLADKEQELKEMSQNLQTVQQKLDYLNQATTGKIDKSLVKNVVLGYLGAQGEHKTQALRILTAVLEMNEIEKSRAGLQAGEGGWLSSLLHPSPSSNNSTSESLSQAFVRFLESESRPQPQLRLLPDASAIRDTPKRAPMVLSELVLPSVTPTQVSDSTDSALTGVFNDS